MKMKLWNISASCHLFKFLCYEQNDGCTGIDLLLGV